MRACTATGTPAHAAKRTLGARRLIFSCFCVVLAYYVWNGLVGDSMAFGDEVKRNLRFSVRQLAYYIPVLFLASILTGYIGVTVDKVLFMLLTWSHGAHVRDATITGTTLVGWLSAVAALLHMASPCDARAAMYVGAVPYHFWLAGLPGLLLGSLLGPTLNVTVGSRNVMKLFLVMLTFDFFNNVYDLLVGWSDLEGRGSCTPQCPDREEMQLFVAMQQLRVP
jgi:uncharacterized membrane protein YfcA